MDHAVDRYRVAPGTAIDLRDHDPRDTAAFPDVDKAGAPELLATINAQLADLQARLAAGAQHSVLVVLQGMDTSGKDGTIRNVFHGVNPQGVRVVSFKTPTERERSHDFLWRIHQHAPAAGEIGIFNRSHYEDVVIVRVHDLVPEPRWRARYAHINEFEAMLVDEGTTIVKLLLHISKDEQRKRLQARIDDPTKNWKFEHGDLDEREHWDEYSHAHSAAISKTSTEHAPWWIVPADRKWYRDLVVSTVLVNTLDALDLSWPEPNPELEGLVVE